jgi:hypothetical protein
MRISVSPAPNNQTLLETSNNVAVLFDDGAPVAVRIGSFCLAANSCPPDMVDFQPKAVVPQSEIDYIVRMI